MCIYTKLLQSCPTLCDLTDCSPPGSSVYRVSQARTLEWVAMPSSKGSSWPRGWTCVSMSPAPADGFFITSTTWEVPRNDYEKSTKYALWVRGGFRSTIILMRTFRISWLSHWARTNIWPQELRCKCAGKWVMPMKDFKHLQKRQAIKQKTEYAHQGRVKAEENASQELPKWAA